MRLGLIIALVVFGLDQVSKYVIMEHVLGDAAVMEIIPYFNLVRAWNTGVSFSMFNDGGFWGMIFLVALAAAIVGVLLKWLYNEENKLIQAAIGFIIGGAVGNVVDRIRFGAVFDFLDVYYKESHWPAFNMADSFICIGAAMIILHSLLVKQEKED